MRDNPDHERRYRPFLRRVRNGQLEFRCNGCNRWWAEDFFYDNRRQGGAEKYTKCKNCMRAHRAKYAPGYRTRKRKLARERAAEGRRLDKVYEGIFATRKMDDMVPATVVQEWMDIAIERMPTDDESYGPRNQSLLLLSERTGVPYRSLYRIRREAAAITFDIAERIAMAAGPDVHDEMMSAYPVLGREGWGPEGRTSCDRCGTWWRPHAAKGYCLRCYNAVWRAERDGLPVTLPPGAWSRRHASCVRCGQTKKRHHGKGMCGVCYWNVQHLAKGLGMTIDEFKAAGLLVPVGR